MREFDCSIIKSELAARYLLLLRSGAVCRRLASGRAPKIDDTNRLWWCGLGAIGRLLGRLWQADSDLTCLGVNSYLLMMVLLLWLLLLVWRGLMPSLVTILLVSVEVYMGRSWCLLASRCLRRLWMEVHIWRSRRLGMAWRRLRAENLRSLRPRLLQVYVDVLRWLWLLSSMITSSIPRCILLGGSCGACGRICVVGVAALGHQVNHLVILSHYAASTQTTY